MKIDRITEKLDNNEQERKWCEDEAARINRKYSGDPARVRTSAGGEYVWVEAPVTKPYGAK